MPIGKDDDRDDRISKEVLVDAYNRHEQTMGWYYYLERKISFPFEAKCLKERSTSPLNEGEEVHVVEMTDESDIGDEMFVNIEWMGRELGVPLAQLEPLDVDADTEEAIADWHYWHTNGKRIF